MGIVTFLKRIKPLRPILEAAQEKAIELSMRARLKAYADKSRASELPGYTAGRNTIALVIPCFNHARYLSLALKSVLEQARMPDEIVLIDNKSSDNTRDIIEDFRKAHPDLNITAHFNERNFGQAYSLNRAISSSRSDLLMILNADDYLMADAVGTALGIMRENTALHMCGFSCEVFRDDADISAHPKTVGGDRRNLLVKTPSDVRGYKGYNDINMTHTSSVFTRYAWEAVGGFYPEKGRRVVPFSDRDFQLRVNCLFPIGIFPDMKLAFWRDGSSVDAGINS
jgi:glycosyltransferase involved in cell wall biosynthesis